MYSLKCIFAGLDSRLKTYALLRLSRALQQGTRKAASGAVRTEPGSGPKVLFGAVT